MELNQKIKTLRKEKELLSLNKTTIQEDALHPLFVVDLKLNHLYMNFVVLVLTIMMEVW